MQFTCIVIFHYHFRQMKWLAIVLSMYTLMLSAVPCPDRVKVVDDARKTVSITDDGQAPRKSRMTFAHHCVYVPAAVALLFFQPRLL